MVSPPLIGDFIGETDLLRLFIGEVDLLNGDVGAADTLDWYISLWKSP